MGRGLEGCEEEEETQKVCGRAQGPVLTQRLNCRGLPYTLSSDMMRACMCLINPPFTDIISAMSLNSSRNKVRLHLPAKTATKLPQEHDHDLAILPEGTNRSRGTILVLNYWRTRHLSSENDE